MTFVPFEKEMILKRLVDWVEKWKDEPLDDPQIDNFYETFGTDAHIMRIANKTTYTVGDLEVAVRK
jgi:hypothetical protein